MELGIIGLGKMGGNMAERLRLAGHKVIGFDFNAAAVQKLTDAGSTGVTSLEAMCKAFTGRKAIWIMVPAGDPVDQTIANLKPFMQPGDIFIDGGNSNYKDSQRRHDELKKEGYDFVDVVTSGAGHFVKMVHNGIEYGIMQAYAEGFSIMKAKAPLNLDLVQISEIWRYGSVVRSWLLDLTADALKKNPTLEGLEAFVPDSGEGRWTVFEAIDLNVSAPVITESLIRRLRSREENNFTDRMLSVMRNEFGGHAVKKS